MSRVVRRTELLRPIASERLRLVAPGEKGQLLWRFMAQGGKPVGRDLQRLFPADLLKLARPTRANTFHRIAQTGRGVVLHDPGRALGAEHAAVHRVVAVAFDIGDLALFHMHVDAAAAGAHVAGGAADLVRDLGR